MTEHTDSEISRRAVKRNLLKTAVLLLLFISAILLLLNPFLNSPFVAGRISRILSDAINQPARVAGIRMSAGSIMISNIDIMNPAGFPAGKLVSIGYLEVSPEWLSIFRGKTAFSSIKVHGMRCSLLKNAAGDWNFAGISSVTKKKKGGAGVFIKTLRLDRGIVSLSGRKIEGLWLKAKDISSKGNGTSHLQVGFNDDSGNIYRLEGKGRGGDDPEFDLNLSAPQCSFNVLKGLNLPLDTGKGTWSLKIHSVLRKKVLSIGCEGRVAGAAFKVKGKESSLNGKVELAAHYIAEEDRALLDNLRIDLERVISLNISGRVDDVRKERLFDLVLSHGGVNLERIARVIPGGLPGGLLPKGEALPSTFHVAGNAASGITSAEGKISLRGVGLAAGKRIVLENVAADAVISASGKVWELKGNADQSGPESGALLQLGRNPFNLRLSDRFSPLSGEIPSVKATLAGVPLSGSLNYRGDENEPLSAHIMVERCPVAELVRGLDLKGAEVSGGTLSASLNARGNRSGELKCDAAATLSGVTGKYGKSNVSTGNLSADVTIGWKKGNLSAVGKVAAKDGTIDGRKFSFNIPCRYDGNILSIYGAAGVFADTNFKIAEITVANPAPGKLHSESLPLELGLRGLGLDASGRGAEEISGEIHAVLSTREEKRRLAGNAVFRIPSIIFRKKNAGTVEARFRFYDGKAYLDASGELLGGNLFAKAAAEPFNPGSGVVFSLDMANMSSSLISDFAGSALPVKSNGGTISVTSKGEYGKKTGLKARSALHGTDLAFADKKGKTIFNNGAVDLSAELADNDILVKNSFITIGRDMRISVAGVIKDVAGDKQKGEFTVEMPRTSLNSLFDSFANILPPSLQEAEVAGDTALRGNIGIEGKSVVANFVVDMGQGRLEIPSQKLSITGMKGAVPFSMAMGGRVAHYGDRDGLNRKNFQLQFAELEKKAGGSHNFTIDKIRFGTTEFSATRLMITAGNGSVDIQLLDTGLFNGRVLGRGSVSIGKGIGYWGDILVHDLSLADLCESYPAITGYISGKVDGFLSLSGGGKGLKGMKGYVEFWSRETEKERMLISREFLQKLAGKKMKGMFFQNDRPYDRGEISAFMENGDLTFQKLEISHRNFIGVKDLSVTVMPLQNRISLQHLMTSIKEAASRGKAATGGGAKEEAPPAAEFKWEQ